MTRINSGIEPIELCDQHLVAEYREIGRIGTLLRNRIHSGKDIVSDVPKTFKLGEGHMLFFMDKGTYLEKRFESIKDEMVCRGMNPVLDWRDDWYDVPHLDNDWEPDGTVRKIMQERLKQKMPDFPRYS